MTIAKRLTILVAVPLLALVLLGIFNRLHLSNVEERTRFLADMQVPSLAALGDQARNFAELRVSLRNYLLTTNLTEQARNRTTFNASETEVNRLLQYYADHLVSDDQDRRLLREY